MGTEQIGPFDKLRAAPSSVEGRRKRQRSAGTGGYFKKFATIDHAAGCAIAQPRSETNVAGRGIRGRMTGEPAPFSGAQIRGGT